MKKEYTAPWMKTVEIEVEALTTPSSADVRSEDYDPWVEDNE